MHRPLAKLALALTATTAAAVALPLAAQEAAQTSPGTFSLPPASPSPTPAPAGPADERAGVAIPPSAVATPAPSPAPAATPVIQPLPPATPGARPGARLPAPQRTAPAAAPAQPSAALPAAEPGADTGPLALPSSALPDSLPATPSATLPATPPADTGPAAADPASLLTSLPEGWPYAAGGLGALLLGAAALLLRRRRRPRARGLAVLPAAAETQGPPDLGALELALEITSATRSVMRFTLGYRLAIANRSPRAVSDLGVAVQLACARATGGAGACAGASPAAERIARIGPHQTQTVTGEVHLPLAAIQPLRQGSRPLFVPLVHATLTGEGENGGGSDREIARSFVIGTPSPSGRVHPIPLDIAPGSVTGLVAQAVTIPASRPPASAAA